MHKMEFDRKVVNSKIILCDIEGTTSSIDFVKDTLFPYALKNVEKFLQENWERDDVKEAVVELKKLADKDVEEKVEGAVPVLGEDEDKAKVQESVVKNVEWLMSNDRKVTPLKTLQGLIWEAGYKDGSIKGHVYDDVPKAFENWTKTGHKIFIYSSGSVMAQKLLFGHTTVGDMQTHLSGYFDTKIGAKQEKESYESIVKEVETEASEVLFLTDVVKEAKAARDAGLNVVILDRPGNAPLTDEEKKEYPVIENFDQLPLEEVVTGKRKIQEEVDQKQETTKPAKIAKLESENAEADKPEKMDEAQDEKTDVESKCDTAVVEEKTETERTDGNSKTDQETESKIETEEKMDVDEGEKKTVEVVKEKEEEAVTTTEEEEKKDEVEEKMEVDAKMAEKKVDENVEVTEAEPQVVEEEKEATTTAVEVAVEAVEEIVTETAAEVITETATESIVVVPEAESSSESKDKVETEVADVSKEIETGLEADVTAEITETPESTHEKKEEEGGVNGKMEVVAQPEEKKEEEKVVETTNGNAAVPEEVTEDKTEAVNGDTKTPAEVEKTENGQEEVKNGHNVEKAAATSQDGEETAQESTESTTSAANDQVSEVIVKKCVEAVVKSPSVTKTVEAES